jgi:hypothetical protein
MAVETTRARQRALAIPAWAWVTGIVVVSTLVYYALSRRITAPWILTDEFVYSEAAKSFAATGHMLIREQSGQNPGFLYPALVSPAWRAFSSIPDAYAAAKAINALLISLTAVPAYLLGRRVLSQPFALLCVALSVAVPSMLYSGTIMTENAFYPLFVACAYLLVLVLERPTVVRSLVLVVLVILAFLTRAQGVFLLPAILTAPPLLVLFRRRPLRELVSYWPLYAITALVAIPAVLVQLARGHSVSDLFGRYGVVSDASYPVGSVAKWFVYHIAELDLYLGVVPFAALVLLVVLVRRLESRHQAFLAAAVALSFWLLLVVAAVDQTYEFVHRVAERNMFYAAPLFLIGLLVWIERGMPRPRWIAAVVAVVAAALPAVLPFQWMLNISIVSDTLALIPWWRLDVQLASTTWPRVLLVGACLAAGALFLFLPRRWRLLLPCLVFVYLVVLTAFAEREWHLIAAVARASVGPQADWIDHAVPSGGRVAVVYTAHVPPVPIWEDEFFNRAAGDVYDLGDPMPGALPETHVTVAPGGRLVAAGRIPARYGLSDELAPLAGTAIATSGPLTLYRLPGELALGSVVEGLYPNSSWSGRHVAYRRFHCRGGAVRVTLTRDPTLFITPKTVSVKTGPRTLRLRVPPDRPVTTNVPLVPRAGTCRADFIVTPSPPLSMPRGSPPRPFGLQFTFSQ